MSFTNGNPSPRAQRVRQELPTRAMTALRDALGVFGDGVVTPAPSSAVTAGQTSTVLPVDIDGERYDVHIETKLTDHRPPGWTEIPRVSVGDVIELYPEDRSGAREYEVIAVLGDGDDPRPGYRVRHIGRGQAGTFDRAASDGDERTILPDDVTHRRALGRA